MRVAYQAARRIWYRLPPFARRSLQAGGKLYVLRQWIERSLARRVTHDDVYDDLYYLRVEAELGSSLSLIAESIARELDPATVVDVGCGTGALLAALASRGIVGLGLDYSEAALRICSAKDLAARKINLEAGEAVDLGHFDLVVSTEVAEHLAPTAADRYVALLCSLGNTILMTAATPGQGGTSHINEQPHQYWIDKFDRRGWCLDQELTRRLREHWASLSVALCYSRNLMIFRRHPSRTEAPRA